MRFFTFFQNKQSESRVITLKVDVIDPEVLAKCEKYRYVNLWIKPQSSQIKIFAPNTIGGSGFIGLVPSEYDMRIKQHLSNNGSKSYEAKIQNILANTCTITIQLT
ncbi:MULTISPECIES: hypothetical protein [unclassified Imperialibacter]|uniref:hypothetical protein n=1 Tax=unclassified Imperialibacter TaxID=2629706 RepID=UPI0012515708|nr:MULTISPECIES: hypothetical protein [unclassified Imperialibacter]CAD5253685.1 hypothetical protein IMPERIA89_190017 [Imperialibacter sp. 89]CAD5275459.1 hypothetical protein IMPERIA75_410050 [Imperialibacter sp. 75]VVT19776.1 hypothetical protein IMPR6_290050 [Imperialibacter sp. EC-SDR9]